jgi:hypothetical protein
MAEREEKHAGGCLCGGIRFTVTGPLRPVVNCHCGQCLQWHGNFAAYTAAPWSQIELVGETNLQWFDSSSFARRGFCRRCGSSLFWERPNSGSVSIAAGSLDKPTGLETIRHIFTADLSDYYEITDGHERLPAGQGAG